MSERHDPCADFRAHLPLHVGDDLDPEVRLEVEAHLAGCASCGAELERARRVRATLPALSAASPAPEVDLWPDLREQLRAEGLLGARPRVARAVPAPSSRRWLQMAAAAAVLALSFTAAQRYRPTPAGTQDPLQVAGAGALAAPDLLEVAQPGPELAGGAPLVPVGHGLRRIPAGERLGNTAVPFAEAESELSRVRLGQPLRPWSLASGVR